jgi:hypothetical protein
LDGEVAEPKKTAVTSSISDATTTARSAGASCDGLSDQAVITIELTTQAARTCVTAGASSDHR